jgi:anti-sigma-K factor RskA
MTDRPESVDRDTLAAEHALRLLSGEKHREAAALEAADSPFAARVARWRARFGPFFEEIESVQPPDRVWHRIEHATAGTPVSNVIALRRSADRWRAATIGMTALAASLALVVVQQPRTAPPSAPLVAMLGDRERNMKVVASWDPAQRQLVLAVAGDIPPDPSHAHELWVIPAGGHPRSLGTMPAVKQMHMRVADPLARMLRQGAVIAISAEPPGGSPTDRPSGPMLLSGALDQA